MSGDADLMMQAVSPVVQRKQSYRFVKYTFFRLDSEWRRLPDDQRLASKDEFLSELRKYEQFSPRAYSLVGTRGDADFMLWLITDSLDTIQKLHSDLLNTALGKYLSTPYSYLAMLRPSEYFGKPSDPDPAGSNYLLVYPFKHDR